MILGCHKTERIAYCLGPACPADPMDIILRMEREIIVDHMRNAVHINAPCCNVGCNQHTDFAGFKLLQRTQTLVLRSVGMQRRIRDLAGGEFL